jgi:uncharacterized membrane protein YccC
VSIRARIRSAADWFVISDPGWGRAQMGWRTLVSLVAGMGAAYGVARGLGLPGFLGASSGGLIAFISGVQVADGPVRRLAADLGWFAPSFAVGQLLGMYMVPYRVAGFCLLVVILFLNVYLDRFGHRGHHFGTMLFASYLAGLLAPIPHSVYPSVVVAAIAAIVACLLARTILCWHDPARDLRQTERSFEAATRRAAASAVAVLQSRDGTVRAARRLRRDVDRINTVALCFDGRLGHHRVDGDLAEDLHRRLFDVEHILVSLAELCEALADERDPVAQSAAAAQMAALAAGRPGDPTSLRACAAELRASVHSSHERSSHLLELAADELDAYRLSTRLVSSEVTLAADEHLPFEGVVALEGAQPAGARPLARKAAAAAPEIWWWRVRRPMPTMAIAIQVAIAAAIALPLGYAFDSRHYYWAVIGAMILGAPVSTPHERGRKVLRRAAGTVAGAVVGIALYNVTGPGHPWWTLTVIVLGLVIGAYFITVAYPLFVLGLVITLVQLYGLEAHGSTLNTLLVHRLAENVLGGVIMLIVTLVVLPISTRAVIRAGVRSSLHALSAFVSSLGIYLTNPDADVRLRSDARTLDQALFQTRQVAGHLLPVPGWLSSPFPPGAAAHRARDLLPRWRSYRQRLDEVIAGTSAAASEARTIARHAPKERCRDGALTTAITQIVGTLTTSIAALDCHIDGHGRQEWSSCGPLVRQLLDEQPGCDADLTPTLNAIDELDSRLTIVAAELGLIITDPPVATLRASARVEDHLELAEALPPVRGDLRTEVGWQSGRRPCNHRASTSVAGEGVGTT